MKTIWRFFPAFVAGGIGFVVAVNAGLIYLALHSFPGKASEEGFELSNHYDAVLAHAAQEEALGWSVAAQADAAGRPEVALTDRSGQPLHGASVAAYAERPLGTPERHALAFREVDGRYIADTVLPLHGQWELTLSASLDGHEFAVTRRVIVR